MPSKLFILEGQNQGQCFELEHDKTYAVGRSPRNDIQIKDRSVSRRHLLIREKAEEEYILTDLSSENGTFVNGKDLEPGVEWEVDEGSLIVIGMTILGLGDACKTSLKPLLESIGICCGSYENGKTPNPHRTTALKKNLEFIYNVSNDLVKSKSTHEVLEKTLEHIFNLLKRIDRCAMILIDEKTGEISKVVYRSRKPVNGPESVYNKELVKKALMLNETVYVSDSSDENDANADTLRLRNIRSALCIPICSGLQPRGAIYVDSTERAYGFRMSDIALLTDIGRRISYAMDYIALIEPLR
jgi:pSer/pThr/pTyr-binding forkhead associated (FHA) protein